ncbi:unnamed protein product [Caretta caretta]
MEHRNPQSPDPTEGPLEICTWELGPRTSEPLRHLQPLQGLPAPSLVPNRSFPKELPPPGNQVATWSQSLIYSFAGL